MDLYERIKSPLDDDKTIEELAKIYAEKGNIEYYDIITNGESTDIDKKKQIEEFNKNILKECIEMEAEYLKQLEKKYDISLYTKERNEKLKILEDKLKVFRKEHYDDIANYEKCHNAFEKIGRIPLGDSKVFYENNQEVLKKYNITEDDIKKYMKYDKSEEFELTKKIELFKEKNFDYDTIIKTLNKYTSEELIEILENKRDVSDEEIERIKITFDYIESRHNFQDQGIMGFHIYKDMFEDIDEAQKKDESKLYINADYDQVYKIARLYLEKAKERGINYSFKVNYPKFDKVDRADKFVVFSSLKELTKNIEVLDEIMREHPEFTLKNPGLLVGKLENGIGIGMDSEGKSYNRCRSEFLNKVFKKIFKGKGLDEVKEMINSEEGIIAKIRNKIKSALTKSEISTEKFCLDKEKEEALKNVTGKDVVMGEKKEEQPKQQQDEKKEEQPKQQQNEKKEEQPERQQDEKKEEQPEQQQDEKKEEQPKQQQDEKKEKQPEQQQDEKKEEQPEQQQDEKKEEQPKQQQDEKKEKQPEQQQDEKKEEQPEQQQDEKKDEKEKQQPEEENENQRKMQALVKNLNKLTENMARDYINANYENEPKNREIYQNIINTMVKLRVLEGGTKISKLDMMMEKRRLDAIVSNLVFAYRDHEKSLKYESDTEKSEKNVKYELKKLDEFLKSDIELQDGTKIKVFDEEDVKQKDVHDVTSEKEEKKSEDQKKQSKSKEQSDLEEKSERKEQSESKKQSDSKKQSESKKQSKPRKQSQKKQNQSRRGSAKKRKEDEKSTSDVDKKESQTYER